MVVTQCQSCGGHVDPVYHSPGYIRQQNQLYMIKGTEYTIKCENCGHFERRVLTQNQEA